MARQYLVYASKQTGRTHVGLCADGKTVAPVFPPFSSLFDLIEQWSSVEKRLTVTEQLREDISAVQQLAPLRGRDLLAVGKNYAEHAKEFNASGCEYSLNACERVN